MDKVTFVLDLDRLVKLPASDREAAAEEVGQYLVEAILADVGEAKSPVTGHAFKKLSKAYLQKKEGESSAPIANLELTGEMLDALEFKVLDGGRRVEVGIWGDQADKADGHNNHSGDSKLPRRPFIPRPDESFRPEIRGQVEDILQEFNPFSKD